MKTNHTEKHYLKGELKAKHWFARGCPKFLNFQVFPQVLLKTLVGTDAPGIEVFYSSGGTVNMLFFCHGTKYTVQVYSEPKNAEYGSTGPELLRTTYGAAV